MRAFESTTPKAALAVLLDRAPRAIMVQGPGGRTRDAQGREAQPGAGPRPAQPARARAARGSRRGSARYESRRKPENAPTGRCGTGRRSADGERRAPVSRAARRLAVVGGALTRRPGASMAPPGRRRSGRAVEPHAPQHRGSYARAETRGGDNYLPGKPLPAFHGASHGGLALYRELCACAPLRSGLLRACDRDRRRPPSASWKVRRLPQPYHRGHASALGRSLTPAAWRASCCSPKRIAEHLARWTCLTPRHVAEIGSWRWTR